MKISKRESEFELVAGGIYSLEIGYSYSNFHLRYGSIVTLLQIETVEKTVHEPGDRQRLTVITREGIRHIVLSTTSIKRHTSMYFRQLCTPRPS